MTLAFFSCLTLSYFIILFNLYSIFYVFIFLYTAFRTKKISFNICGGRVKNKHGVKFWAGIRAFCIHTIYSYLRGANNANVYHYIRRGKADGLALSARRTSTQAGTKKGINTRFKCHKTDVLPRRESDVNVCYKSVQIVFCFFLKNSLP